MDKYDALVVGIYVVLAAGLYWPVVDLLLNGYN